MRMRFHEWWSRALVPGQHYVEVTDSEEQMCDKVRAPLGAAHPAHVFKPAGQGCQGRLGCATCLHSAATVPT